MGRRFCPCVCGVWGVRVDASGEEGVYQTWKHGDTAVWLHAGCLWHSSAWTHLDTCVCVHGHLHEYVFVCAYMWMCEHVCGGICINMFVCAYMYVDMVYAHACV